MLSALRAKGKGTAKERWLAAGCAGGMALAAAGSWLRFALEGRAHIDVRSRGFLLGSAAAGAGLLVTGVCSLRLARCAGRLSWPTLVRWGFAVQACAFLALALTSSDVFMNLCFGALSLGGQSPYASTPSLLGPSPFLVPVADVRWIHEASPYGPFFHRLAALAVGVGTRTAWPVWASFWAFKALMLAAVLAALAVAARYLATVRTDAAAEVFATLALGPLVAWEIAGQGHNDGLLFLFLVVFLVAASRDRPALAASALALGITIKYALAPLLGLYLLLLARSSRRRGLLLGILSAAIVGVAIATEWHSISLKALLPMVGGDPGRHAHSLTDLVCDLLDGQGQPAASAVAYRLLSGASTLVCGALLLWTAVRARSLQDLARGYLLFLMALYLTAPWFQPWYVLWALPFLLVEPDPRWRRVLSLYAVVTVVQWAAPLDPVTTVMGNVWAARHLWGLLRDERAAAETPPAALANLVSGAG